MPRKAKEELIEEKKVTTQKTVKSNANSTKKASKTTSKKLSETVVTKSNKKANKTATKSTSKSANSKKMNRKKLPVVEYYDLPNLYNQTIVKILAQTPTVLFVYWDISVEDKQFYLEKYGEDFFTTTTPYLTVTNQTKNYSFEVEINDYANSWYINISDSDCKYDVVLFRKNKNSNSVSERDNIYITSSNKLQTPNDHILFDSLGKNVFFKNIKNDEIESKDISSLSFMKNIGRVYNIYDLYKEIYKNELTENNKLGSCLTSSKMSS